MMTPMTREPTSDVRCLEAAGVPALLAEAAGAGMRALTVNGNVRKGDALLSHGDVLAVDPRRIVADGEIALLRDGEHLVLRRIYREGDGVRLEPLDPRCPPTQIAGSASHLDVQGRVMVIIRRENGAIQSNSLTR
jgi:SOS-response transcriptional repressor LexA